MRLKYVVLFSFFCVAAPLFGLSATGKEPATADSLDDQRDRVIFFIEAAPFFSSVNDFGNGGYTASLGVGYQFGRRFSLTLNVHSGREEIPQTPTRPIGGTLDIGGAGLEGTLFFGRGERIRPFASVGLDLYTLLTGDLQGIGYNGNGFSVGVGVQAEFLDYISANLIARYTRARFYSPVGDDPFRQQFEPFHNKWLGGTLRIAFYPSILK